MAAELGAGLAPRASWSPATRAVRPRRPPPNWYEVLACYKIGCILEGTYARACAGSAPKETGDLLHAFHGRPVRAGGAAHRGRRTLKAHGDDRRRRSNGAGAARGHRGRAARHTAPGSSPARRSRGSGRSARPTSSGSATTPRRTGRSWRSGSRTSARRRRCSPRNRRRFFTIPHFDGYAAVLIQLKRSPSGRCARRSSTAGWPARRRSWPSSISAAAEPFALPSGHGVGLRDRP